MEEAQLTFDVVNQTIERTDNFVVVAESQNYLRAKFNFLTDEWVDPKIVTMYNSNFKRRIELSDDECLVPWELLREPGIFYVAVSCGNFIPTNYEIITVEPSGDFCDKETPFPPTFDLYEKLIADVKEIEESVNQSVTNAQTAAKDSENSAIESKTSEINAAAEAATAKEQAKIATEQATKAAQEANKAENISLNPPKIQNGNWYVYQDGEYKDTGVKAEGEAGADGKTPVKGVDYFTEADKQELVSAVITALPKAEEVSF